MKKCLSIVSVVLMALALTACGGAQPDAGAETGADPALVQGNHLVVAVPSFPVSLDNTMANEFNSLMVHYNIVETLVRFDGPNFNVVPGLAESWEMPDPQTVIMYLRQGVLFHNGNEMRASDVAFSIMRGVDSPPVRFILNTIESVDVIDDFTVQINLNIPFAPILNHLTHPGAGVNCERAVLEAGDDFANHPIGTGPFMFSSMSLGDYVELVRFEDYWGEQPGVDGITITVIPEVANRLIAVETGSAHISFDISPHDIPRLQEDPNLAYNRAAVPRIHFLGFNHQSPTATPLLDPRVRQAINYAIDVEAIVDVVYQGLGRIVHGPMVGIPGSLEFDGFEFNLDRARELMAEAGYADGFSLELWNTADNQLEVDTSVILQNMLGQIGIDVNIVSVEFAAFLASINNGEHDAYVLSWNNITADPDYALTLFHGGNIPSPNRFRYQNTELDRLLDMGREELNAPARLEIYRQAQHIIAEDMPAVFLLQGEELTALSPQVQGFVNFPIRTSKFNTVYFAN